MFGRKMRNYLIFSFSAAVVAFSVEHAFAQQAPSSDQSGSTSQKGEVQQDKSKILNLDETVVEGKVQKPEAFYLLEDAGLEHDDDTDKPNYLKEIVKAAREAGAFNAAAK